MRMTCATSSWQQPMVFKPIVCRLFRLALILELVCIPNGNSLPTNTNTTYSYHLSFQNFVFLRCQNASNEKKSTPRKMFRWNTIHSFVENRMKLTIETWDLWTPSMYVRVYVCMCADGTVYGRLPVLPSKLDTLACTLLLWERASERERMCIQWSFADTHTCTFVVPARSSAFVAVCVHSLCYFSLHFFYCSNFCSRLIWLPVFFCCLLHRYCFFLLFNPFSCSP